MNKSVFIVTTGSYSDYCIDSVWATREAAESHAAALKGYDEPDVQEWLINTAKLTPLIQWRATLRANEAIVVSDHPIESQEIEQTKVRWEGRGLIAGWYGSGYGPTPGHARKNLSDALAKAKAERAKL